MKRWLWIWMSCLLLVGWSATGYSAARPDERVLWQLLHAGKTRLLRQAIQEYREQYPGWMPPAELQRAMQSPRRQAGRPQVDRATRLQEQIGKAIRRQEWAALIRLFDANPEFFTCSRVGHLRVLALAYARSGKMVQAGRHYRRLLSCPGTPVQEVLEEAMWTLPAAEFRGLLASARSSLSSGVYADFDYRSRRQLLWEAHQRDDQDQFGILAEGLAGQALQRKDQELVQLVAWHWHDRQQWQRAANWFRLGLELAPDDPSLLQGLLSTAIKLQQDEQVASLANEYGVRHPRLREEAAGYLLMRAWTLYRRGSYREGRVYARLAGSWLADPASAEYLLAWLDMEDEAYFSARQRFGELYRKHPENREYAQALVSSNLRSGEDLDELARAFPGNAVLDEILSTERSRQSYNHKQFLLARHQDPEDYPQLENIESPSLSGAGLYRYKSGVSGLDRLDTFIAPLLVMDHPLNQQHFSLQLGFQHLQNGGLGEAGIGTLQASDRRFSPDERQVLEDEARQLRDNPPTRRVNAALLEFNYRLEGPLNPYASIGLMPLGGPLSPLPTFRLGIGD